MSVDLSSVPSKVGTLLQNDYGWKDFGTHYWLDTIPFGMEDGPQSGTVTGAGSSYFSLRLSSYCLTVGSTLSAATCAKVGKAVVIRRARYLETGRTGPQDTVYAGGGSRHGVPLACGTGRCFYHLSDLVR